MKTRFTVPARTWALVIFMSAVGWASIYAVVSDYRRHQEEQFLKREETEDCRILGPGLYAQGVDCHGAHLPSWGKVHGAVDMNSSAYHRAHPYTIYYPR